MGCAQTGNAIGIVSEGAIDDAVTLRRLHHAAATTQPGHGGEYGDQPLRAGHQRRR
jgi:hypothetical protein